MEVPPHRSTVTAVIPHWNRRDLLAPLLANLAKQTRAFDEILVVDNGSTDGSAELATQLGASVIQLDRNLGFAAAVNRGIAAAQSDWFAILNNDVALASDWLEILLAGSARQETAFLTGKILSAGNPTVLDGAFDEVSRAACAARCGSGKPDAPIWNEPRPIRFAPMTAALFRSDVFRRLGGLDEIFGSYMEDVDFGIRCALAGYVGRYEPAAVAYHQGSTTFGKWSADSVWRIARNQVLLAAKYFTAQPRLPIVIGQSLWGLVALRHGCGWAFLRGKLAGLKDRHLLRQQQPGPQQPCKQEPEPETTVKLANILEASEREILELGRQTGLDNYWRAYFWLFPR